MYLSTLQIQEVALSKLATQDKISHIYISNECHKTKATGNLFLHVMKELQINPHELLHIGDNLRSDITIAQSFGIQTLHYGQNTQQKERLKHESCYMQEDFKDGNHVRTLGQLLNPYTDDFQKFYFDIGASIFGPILWEFSHWLAEITKRFELEKISFIMREGAIFQKYFAMLYPDIESNLLYASRKSTNFLTLNIDDLGSVNFNMYKHFTIENLYASFFLKIKNEMIEPYAQTLCEDAQNHFIGTKTLLALAIEDIQNKAPQIKNILNEQKEFLLKYLHDLHINKHTSLLDFGGSGTIIKKITDFLPQALRPKTNILFYQHAQGYKKLSNEHVVAFLTYTKKTAKAIESIHRSPEFIEILLNGTNETTQSYLKNDMKIRPKIYMPKSNKKNIHTITEAFNNGVKLFFKLAKNYKVSPKSYDRNILTLLLSRLIELPTQEESKFLGILEYDEGKASEYFYSIVDTKKLEFIQKFGIDKIHQDFIHNPIKHRHQVPWMEGAITQIAPSYLLKYYGASTNPNQEIVDSLLEKLDVYQQKQIMVYGAGELFVQLLPYLYERNIKIEAVIDSRAEIHPFMVEGFHVISLKDALKEKEKAVILIASGVYSQSIQKTIEDFRTITSIEIIVLAS